MTAINTARPYLFFYRILGCSQAVLGRGGGGTDRPLLPCLAQGDYLVPKQNMPCCCTQGTPYLVQVRQQPFLTISRTLKNCHFCLKGGLPTLREGPYGARILKQSLELLCWHARILNYFPPETVFI